MKRINMRWVTLSVLSLSWFVVVDASDLELSGIKCVVNGKSAVSKDAVATYRGSKVYACCPGCIEQFKANPKAYATRANEQLVRTGQFKQTGCPMSGGKHDPEKMVDVDGVKVGFCCGGCLQHAQSLTKLTEQKELVFGEKAFKKGFTKVAKKVNLSMARCILYPEKAVSAEAMVAYRDANVYFSCDKCAAKFASDPSQYVISANRQLVATGQYKQLLCPLSGEPTDAAFVGDVDGVQVAFRSAKVLEKVNSMTDKEAKSKLVFGEETFAKTFRLSTD